MKFLWQCSDFIPEKLQKRQKPSGRIFLDALPVGWSVGFDLAQPGEAWRAPAQQGPRGTQQGEGTGSDLKKCHLRPESHRAPDLSHSRHCPFNSPPVTPWLQARPAIRLQVQDPDLHGAVAGCV